MAGVIATGVVMEPVQAAVPGGLSGAFPGKANPVVSLPYLDIVNHPYKESIQKAFDRGFFAESSKAIKQFYPDRPITRAEFFTLTSNFIAYNDFELFPLVLRGESDILGRGEGMNQPYLPYKDVDYMTWMYPGILKVYAYHERLSGPRTLSQLFPGDEFYPNKPITQEEAAKVLSVFAVPTLHNKPEWEKLLKSSNGILTRAEAAVLLNQVQDELETQQILPLMDERRSLYPLLPVHDDGYPLFADYASPTEQDKIYMDVVKALKDYTEDETTFEALEKLSDDFPNQVGVHYYKSWNYFNEIEENLKQAFLAIDAYLAKSEHDAASFEYLLANVYDIGQYAIQADKLDLFEKAYKELNGYEEKLVKGSDEWKKLGIYTAAFEIYLGKNDQAIDRYVVRVDDLIAVKNGIYYLLKADRYKEAVKLLDQAKKADTTKQYSQYFQHAETQLDILSPIRQNSYASVLVKSFEQMDQIEDLIVQTEMNFSGSLFNVTEQLDGESRVTHTKGIFQAYDKAVLNKMEAYRDYSEGIDYIWDNEERKWKKEKRADSNQLEYLHEAINGMSIETRREKLKARYMQQSFGSYHIITEWFDSSQLDQYAKKLTLKDKKLLYVPTYVTKYYIDTKSNQLIRKSWEITEVYDNGEIIEMNGDESYDYSKDFNLVIPEEVTKGAVEKHESK